MKQYHAKQFVVKFRRASTAAANYIDEDNIRNILQLLNFELEKDEVAIAGACMDATCWTLLTNFRLIRAVEGCVAAANIEDIAGQEFRYFANSNEASGQNKSEANFAMVVSLDFVFWFPSDALFVFSGRLRTMIPA